MQLGNCNVSWHDSNLQPACTSISGCVDASCIQSHLHSLQVVLCDGTLRVCGCLEGPLALQGTALPAAPPCTLRFYVISVMPLHTVACRQWNW